MTPRDTAEFYRRVATRTLLGPAGDRLLAKLLATQHTHDRLPRLLLDENGTSWAGKTGSYGGVRNDSGILTTKKGRFVLVAFADRIPDANGRDGRGDPRDGRHRGGDRERLVRLAAGSPARRRASPPARPHAARAARGDDARRGPREPRRACTSTASSATRTAGSGTSGAPRAETRRTPASSRCRTPGGRATGRGRSSRSRRSSSTTRRRTRTRSASRSSRSRRARSRRTFSSGATAASCSSSRSSTARGTRASRSCTGAWP